MTQLSRNVFLILAIRVLEPFSLVAAPASSIFFPALAPEDKGTAGAAAKYRYQIPRLRNPAGHLFYLPTSVADPE